MLIDATRNDNSKMAESTYISAFKQDSSEIPQATPTFYGFANTAVLVWILFDVGVSVQPKMAAITGSTYVSHIHSNHTRTVQFVVLDN